jgi:vitamin B12 transporter
MLHESVRVSGAYFNQRFAELIQFVAGGPPSFKGSYENLTSAAANGYEAELEIEPRSGFRGSASYTVVNPRVTGVSDSYTGSDRAGDALIRRASHSGKIVAAFTATSGASVSTSIGIIGKRPDLDFAQFPSPRVTLPGYTKTDVSAEVPLTAQERGGLTLTARIENLFDRQYEDVLYFRAPGRIVFVGARAVGLF